METATLIRTISHCKKILALHIWNVKVGLIRHSDEP